MPAPRKTVTITDLVGRVNHMLAAEGGTTEGRMALVTMLESVLMDADQYRGFNYLPDQFQTVDLPGGSRRELREDWDRTRVFFYAPRT